MQAERQKSAQKLAKRYQKCKNAKVQPWEVLVDSFKISLVSRYSSFVTLYDDGNRIKFVWKATKGAY